MINLLAFCSFIFVSSSLLIYWNSPIALYIIVTVARNTKRVVIDLSIDVRHYIVDQTSDCCCEYHRILSVACGQTRTDNINILLRPIKPINGHNNNNKLYGWTPSLCASLPPFTKILFLLILVHSLFVCVCECLRYIHGGPFRRSKNKQMHVAMQLLWAANIVSVMVSPSDRSRTLFYFVQNPNWPAHTLLEVEVAFITQRVTTNYSHTISRCNLTVSRTIPSHSKWTWIWTELINQTTQHISMSHIRVNFARHKMPLSID